MTRAEFVPVTTTVSKRWKFATQQPVCIPYAHAEQTVADSAPAPLPRWQRGRLVVAGRKVPLGR